MLGPYSCTNRDGGGGGGGVWIFRSKCHEAVYSCIKLQALVYDILPSGPGKRCSECARACKWTLASLELSLLGKRVGGRGRRVKQDGGKEKSRWGVEGAGRGVGGGGGGGRIREDRASLTSEYVTDEACVTSPFCVVSIAGCCLANIDGIRPTGKAEDRHAMPLQPVKRHRSRALLRQRLLRIWMPHSDIVG